LFAIRDGVERCAVGGTEPHYHGRAVLCAHRDLDQQLWLRHQGGVGAIWITIHVERYPASPLIQADGKAHARRSNDGLALMGRGGGPRSAR
jgi:hypothetical protein